MSPPFVIDTEQLPLLQWSFLPPMRTSREGFAAVSVGTETIAVVGGYHHEDKFLKSCAAFRAGQWKNLPDMDSPRMGCGACSFGRTVVVAGGFTKGRIYLDTVEMLDTTSLQWTPLPSMSITRAGCAAVALGDGVIVVLGGWKDDNTAVDTVEQLNVSTGVWTLLPRMLSTRAGCVAVSVDNNKIVVMGGYSNDGCCLSTAEVFDVVTQTWSALPSMEERRDAGAACVVGNCVMVFGGGLSSIKPSMTCEVLNIDDPEAGWFKLPPLKSPRYGCAAATMGNRVIVMGGRGADSQHLESVETVTLPLLDDQSETKSAKKEITMRKQEEAAPDLESSTAHAIPEEWKRVVDSTLKMAQHMMKKDKARTNEFYEKAKTQSKDEYEDKVKEVEKRLKEIELERKRLLRAKAAACRQRDEKLLKLEEQRRQELDEIEKHFQPLIARAASSSALENFSGDSTLSIASSTSDADEEKEPPQELMCCITGALMVEPVTAVDGHTYERAAIEAWFKRFKLGEKPTSPMTNEKLSSRRLIPSHNIRSQCHTWLKKEGIEDPSVLEVQSCTEARSHRSSHVRQRSSSATRAVARTYHRHSSSRSLFSGRASSEHRRTTEPPSPLGRSFTLFGRSAGSMATARRPSA